MIRKLILGAAILALVPLIGCQSVSRIPEVIAKWSGSGSSSSASIPYSAPASYSGAPRSGALEARSVEVGGLSRAYYIYAPSAAATGQPTPMVLAFHGGGGGAVKFAERMDLVSMAEKYGVILVLPQGEGRPGFGRRNGRGGSWNADSITPTGYAENNGINDLGFVEVLLRNVPASYSVDRSRIYAMGFSKGGMMAYRSACMLRGKISAMAAVASTLSSADCPNPQGVSVLHIHGTNDQNVPFNGGVGEFTSRRGNWPPVQRGLQFFAEGNQCFLGSTTSRPASDTTCTITMCNGNEKIELCMVQGGGHAWPGAQPAKWQIKRNVYVSQNFDATDYIARFLLSQ